jgi:hypothetical protein
MDILSLPILEWGGVLPFGVMPTHLPVFGHGWDWTTGMLGHLGLTLPDFANPGYDAAHGIGWAQPVLAQQFEQTDLAGQLQSAWANFVETGQIWAMAIGIVFGYMFRSFTS